jgi:hypothetical protein
MSSDAFVRRFIDQLQALGLAGMWGWGEGATALARFLERMLAEPTDEWLEAMPLTVDEAHDRLLMADFLERAAYQPPSFPTPSWSRNFSELMAWMLRKHYPLTPIEIWRAAGACWSPSGRAERRACRIARGISAS